MTMPRNFIQNSVNKFKWMLSIISLSKHKFFKKCSGKVVLVKSREMASVE